MFKQVICNYVACSHETWLNIQTEFLTKNISWDFGLNFSQATTPSWLRKCFTATVVFCGVFILVCKQTIFLQNTNAEPMFNNEIGTINARSTFYQSNKYYLLVIVLECLCAANRRKCYAIWACEMPVMLRMNVKLAQRTF